MFGRERSVITKHINNIFAESELEEKSNVQKMHIATSDKPVAFYSLDVTMSEHDYTRLYEVAEIFSGYAFKANDMHGWRKNSKRRKSADDEGER